jgi:acyl-CoA thioester hydrolase
MRHTAYNDYAAQLRLLFFEEHGFSFLKLSEMSIGPILFREETRFFREVRMGEKISVDVQLSKARKDASKWSFRQNIYKDNDEISAIIEVDGAWLDLKKRKIVVPPSAISEMIMEIPKADDFEWLPDKVK